MRAAVQLLLVQASGEVHAAHAARMPVAPLVEMLDTLEQVSGHARAANDDMPLRRALAFAQADDQVLSVQWQGRGLSPHWLRVSCYIDEWPSGFA